MPVDVHYSHSTSNCTRYSVEKGGKAVEKSFSESQRRCIFFEIIDDLFTFTCFVW
jgi:hypothetical protein